MDTYIIDAIDESGTVVRSSRLQFGSGDPEGARTAAVVAAMMPGPGISEVRVLLNG